MKILIIILAVVLILMSIVLSGCNSVQAKAGEQITDSFAPYAEVAHGAYANPYTNHQLSPDLYPDPHFAPASIVIHEAAYRPLHIRNIRGDSFDIY